MKSFKDYIKTTQSDVARQFMGLYGKQKDGPLNPFDQAKYNIMKDKMSDPMIKHRIEIETEDMKKPESKRLPPTRSGSKGDGGGAGDGGSGGGNGQ